jgi:hypothetical protein
MTSILRRVQARTKSLGLVIAAVVCLSHQAHAVEVDPGDYTALPAGVNAFVMYGQYAKRDAIYATGDRQPINPSLDSTVGIARVLRVIKLSERWTVDPQFLLPFGELRAGGDVSALGSTRGVGDLILATAFKYKIDEKSGEVFGFAPFLWLPTGKYDSSQVLNLGENRWKLALQAAYTRPIAGNWRWDLIGDVQFHGDNDECRAACGSAVDVTRKQKQLYQLQTHLRYQVSPVLSLAGSYGHIDGGRTTIDGVDQSDKQKTDYVRLSAGYFVNPTTQILTVVGRDLRQENGFRENFRLNLRLLKIF